MMTIETMTQAELSVGNRAAYDAIHNEMMALSARIRDLSEEDAKQEARIYAGMLADFLASTLVLITGGDRNTLGPLIVIHQLILEKAAKAEFDVLSAAFEVKKATKQ